jgi:molybdate transport system regulatory protein
MGSTQHFRWVAPSTGASRKRSAAEVFVMKRSKFPELQLRVKFTATAFGPGKAELLSHIESTGSISAAARAMRMSYKRAWQLVDDMNQAFRSPVVMTAAGGSQGGGAVLTPVGKRVLAAYLRLRAAASSAGKRELDVLARLARKPN